jgi:hypothetical protein
MMIRLSIAGQAVELNHRDFLTVIAAIAGGYHTQAWAYHHGHPGGFADWKNALPRTLEMVGWETPMETVEGQIDDEELREAFHSMREHLQELINVDEQIIAWLAAYVGLSSSQGERNRRRMDQRLNKILEAQGPVWVTEQEYQTFVGRSDKEMLAVTEAEERLDRRLEQLRRRFDEDSGCLPGTESSL